MLYSSRSIIYIVSTSFIFYFCTSEERQEPIGGVEGEIDRIENSLQPTKMMAADTSNYFSIEDRMKEYATPGVSIAVIKDGKIHWAKAYGTANTETGSTVTTETLFQAGSISKPLAALSVLKLWEEGQVSIDSNINTYLSTWNLEENGFTENEPVTFRRLLTHTAGTTVHGFPGYKPYDTIPSNAEVLDGLGNTPRVFVDTIPNSIWRYSGGGYTIAEHAVENVTGREFSDYMDNEILNALGMDHSTYTQPLREDWHGEASAAYDSEGKLIEGTWHVYPEQAAAGLWTTPTDLANYMLHFQDIMKGEEGLLKKATVEAMLTKHKNDWGLGPSLQFSGDSLTFGHGGKNAGFSNIMMGGVYDGNGLIVMTSADRGTALMSEIGQAICRYYGWHYMKPQIMDSYTHSMEELQSLIGDYHIDKAFGEDPDYTIEVVLEDDQLKLIDEVGKRTWVMTGVGPFEFQDLTNNTHFKFVLNDDQTVKHFVYNKQFICPKVPLN